MHQRPRRHVTPQKEPLLGIQRRGQQLDTPQKGPQLDTLLNDPQLLTQLLRAILQLKILINKPRKTLTNKPLQLQDLMDNLRYSKVMISLQELNLTFIIYVSHLNRSQLLIKASFS